MGGFGLGMLNTQYLACLPKDHLGSTSLGHGQRPSSLFFIPTVQLVLRVPGKGVEIPKTLKSLDCGNSIPLIKAAQDTYSTQGLATPKLQLWPVQRNGSDNNAPNAACLYFNVIKKWIISFSIKALASSGSFLAAVLNQSNPKDGSVPNQETATEVVTKSDILETQPGVFRDGLKLPQWSCNPRKLWVTY